MIISLFLAFTGILGFITLFMILFGYKSNKIINIYLVIILFLMSSRFLNIGINQLINNNNPPQPIIRTFNVFFIFVAPCFYLYFKNLIASQKNFVIKDLFHFIFPLLFIIESRFSIYENLLNNPFPLVYLFILYLIVTDILLFLMLKKNIWNKKGSLEIVAKQNLLIKRWSIYLYTAINLFLLRLIISLIIENRYVGFISGQYAIWVTAVIWVFIFVKILTSPEILYGYSFLLKKSKENKNYVTTNISHWNLVSKVKITNVQDLQLRDRMNQNIEKYLSEIDEAAEKNNYFRDSKFTLADFASKLNIPKSHLSYLFKYHSEISFSDYKKIARIEDALHLIQADYLKTNTFDSMAKEVGFSSYNPFFTSFKDIIGTPPQEYCTTIEKQL
jgi:AraC-like DNA-binding protein